MNWSSANRHMGAYGVRDGVDRAVTYILVLHFWGWLALAIALLGLQLIAATYEVWQNRKQKTRRVNQGNKGVTQ